MIRLVSDQTDFGRWQNIPSNAIYSNDYYAIVIDTFENVSYLLSVLLVFSHYVSETFKLLNLQLRELMLIHMLAAAFNPGGRFIILCISPNATGLKEFSEDLAEQVFELMYNRLNAARVIFLYADDPYTYKLYGTNPYRNTKDCGKLGHLQAIRSTFSANKKNA